jgi:hypothetical protein
MSSDLVNCNYCHFLARRGFEVNVKSAGWSLGGTKWPPLVVALGRLPATVGPPFSDKLRQTVESS